MSTDAPQAPKHPFVKQEDPDKLAKDRTMARHREKAQALKAACQGTDDDVLWKAWKAYQQEVGKVHDDILVAHRNGSRAELIAAVDKIYPPEGEQTLAIFDEASGLDASGQAAVDRDHLGAATEAKAAPERGPVRRSSEVPQPPILTAPAAPEAATGENGGVSS